jgi:polyphosphate kinase 2 (PPK2 family)
MSQVYSVGTSETQLTDLLLPGLPRTQSSVRSRESGAEQKTWRRGGNPARSAVKERFGFVWENAKYENDLRAPHRARQTAAPADAESERVLVIIEGFTALARWHHQAADQHMSRGKRVFAPSKLSTARILMVFSAVRAPLCRRGEFVIFNRSWYNRAGVEGRHGLQQEGCRMFLRHRQRFRSVCAFRNARP